MKSAWIVGAMLALAGPLRGDSQPSLDELLNVKPAATTAPTPGRSATPGSAAPAPGKATPPATTNPPSQSGDPTTAIVEDMRQVSERLGRGLDPGIETQRMQEGILARLDQLIKIAKQRQSSSSSSSSSSGGAQPQQDKGSQANAKPTNQGKGETGAQKGDKAGKGDNRGETGAADKVDAASHAPLRENRDQWGNLPPRVRDELLQGSGEQFSPIYREMTEAYYRRLAEEAK